MKNVALIFIALMGTAVVSFAQDGAKKQEPQKKTTYKKVEAEKSPSIKRVVKSEEPKKKSEPTKKTN